jgi:exonuclease III
LNQVTSQQLYEVNRSRTIVIGVYGISENNDRSSADLIQEVSNIARELKHLYNTQHVIVAGDFNAVLSPEDSNDHHIRKQEQQGNCIYCSNNMISQT